MEQGFRAVRAADLAARPLKDIAQIALLKFGDRGKIRDDEGPAPDPDAADRWVTPVRARARSG